jgi:hypothetical protein
LSSRRDGRPPGFFARRTRWSRGIVLAERCSLSRVSCHWAELLGQSDNSVRQRWRQFYQEASATTGAKRGVKRRACDVSVCVVPLVRRVLSFWSCRRLAEALDVTNLGDRFDILCVSVLDGGIGIPVAWKVLQEEGDP